MRMRPAKSERVMQTLLHPPSIPSKESNFGFVEIEGKLHRGENTEKIFSGVKDDKVGPGHYDVS